MREVQYQPRLGESIRIRRRFFATVLYLLALFIILCLILLVPTTGIDLTKFRDVRLPRMNEARGMDLLAALDEPQNMQQEVAGLSRRFRRGGPELNSQGLKDLLRKATEKNRETASASATAAAPSTTPTKISSAGFVNIKCECREEEERR